MNKTTLLAWVLTAVFVLLALVAAIGQPLHWKRTFALAAILAVVAAVVGMAQSRRATRI